MSEESRLNPDPTVLTTQGLLREISHMRELMAEKFERVFAVLEEREKLRQLSVEEGQNAIKAAFDAAEKAVLKSESSTNKQLDLQGARITDISDRMTRLEGRGSGSSATWGYVIGGIGILTGVLSLLSRFIK